LASEQYEESLLEFLIFALYARVGEPGTLRVEGKTTRFDLKQTLGRGEFAAAVPLTFQTPHGRALTHRVGILVTTANGKLLAIDLKWAVSDLDAIKARAYDMLLLKQSLGEQLWGMMIYLRPAGGGITGEQAREICFTYDQFFAIEHQDPQNPTAWVPILDQIEKMIQQK